ncbi:MAG: hypothetical protein MnENMB40S_29970 [Rhizobiaceae bacterium MnEN-MB40S]|nr:MAG: hypothetical protein MnENMB40S_29970 [Rhizobiaceae bacterium MnEN-MB40S]
MPIVPKDVQVDRSRHTIDTGRGVKRSLNGVDGAIYRNWLRKQGR